MVMLKDVFSRTLTKLKSGFWIPMEDTMKEYEKLNQTGGLTGSVGFSSTILEQQKTSKKVPSSGLSSVSDPVYSPQHYTSIKGVECLDIIAFLKMSFNRGSAFKYLWRAGRKDPKKYLEDLNKARFYLSREIEELSR